MIQQLDMALAEVAHAAEERHKLTMECLTLLTSLIRMMQSQDADLQGMVDHLRALPTAQGGRLQPQGYPVSMPATGGYPATNGHDYLGDAKQQGLAALDKLKTAMRRAGQEPAQPVGYDNGDYDYCAGGQPSPPYRNGSN